MTALTLAVVALILLFLAATALAGWLYLHIKERGPERPAVKTQACDLELHDRCMKDWCICGCHAEPPAWVNDGTAPPVPQTPQMPPPEPPQPGVPTMNLLGTPRRRCGR